MTNKSLPPIAGVEFFNMTSTITGIECTYMVIGSDAMIWDGFNFRWKDCSVTAGQLRRQIPNGEHVFTKIH